MSKQMPFLSFIVGFRNREVERVKLFLESLKSINENDFELIFVDYGSNEKIAESVKQIVLNYPFACYYFFDSRGQNWNRAKCLNYGFSKSKGEYVFTSDIDFLYSVDFISVIKKIITPIHAYYFQVGFLSQKQSENILVDSEKYEIESYSDEEAVGALLISRQMFTEVGGYDEFYEIWGVEDNDLLYRIRMTENKVSFYSERILIWHIWHLPVRQSSVLPEGWLKYLKDYFEHKKRVITSANQNHYCRLDVDRPIINKKENLRLIEVKVCTSERFLPLLLWKSLTSVSSNEGIVVKFDFSNIEKIKDSRLNKIVRRANAFFERLNSPLILKNRNMDLYLDEIQARAAIQYFLKNYAEFISDSYVPDDMSKEPVFILKR